MEVVALVSGIVSAFAGATSLYRNWKKDRRGAARHREDEKQSVNDSLVRGSRDVQSEYDRNYGRLGHQFAVGDGKCSLQSNQVMRASC